jgi:hypothetical protein
MCGTFDVKNYGDMMFPIVLRHELEKRIPNLEVECFSYYAKEPPDWPYPVTSLTRLREVVQCFDGVVIGGGHLVRFDKDVAPGYVPPSPDLHHPTSYWLLLYQAAPKCHWDQIATIATTPHETRRPTNAPFLQGLPFLLEDAKNS